MKKKTWLYAILCICIALFLTVPSHTANAATVKLNKTSVTLAVDKKVTLKVLNSTGKVTWTTKNKGIATVSSAGVVTGKKAGSTTITAKVSGRSFNCSVKIVNASVSTSFLSYVADWGGDLFVDHAAAKFYFALEGDSTQVKATIKDPEDRVVFSKTFARVKGDITQEFDWNGLDLQGNPVKEGNYLVTIKAGTTVHDGTFTIYGKNDFAGGHGSEKDPYQVASVEQFTNMQYHTGCYYVQTEDIDFSYQKVDSMFPSDNRFDGFYDGNNKRLSNFVASDALFYYIDYDSAIENVVIQNGYVTNTDSANGYGLALLNFCNYGTIRNCTVSGVVNGTYDCASLCAYNRGQITNCTASGTVTVTFRAANAGGLVAYNSSVGAINDCKANVNIIANSTEGEKPSIAGFVEWNEGTILGSTASGTLEANIDKVKTKDYIAGFACTNQGIINGCTYTGSTECSMILNGADNILR